MIRPYTTPEIKKYSNNDWCVEYWYQYPPDHPQYPGMKRIKVRDGINYIKDPERKEAEILELRDHVLNALEKLNYSPFAKTLDREEKFKNALKQKSVVADTIVSAFDWFIDQKRKLNKADRTIDGYRSFLKNFRLWIDERNSNSSNEKLLAIDQITTDVIESYLESSSENWSARTYNNNLKGLITVFSYLKKKNKIKINPLADGVIETRTSRAERNKYYDKATRKLINPALKAEPYLNLFVQWIYYSCARTNELPRLRVCDIDLHLRKINVPAAIGKTGAHIGSRTIPICEELYDIIIKMGLEKEPRDHFVFSKNNRPGSVQLRDDYFRDIYLPIKRSLNLDPNYTLYSFKHTRVVDLLAAGYPAQKVMFLTGHTDWTSFQKYCRELGAVIDDQLKGKTVSY